MAQAQPAYHDRAFDAPGDIDTFITTETTGFVKEGAPIEARLDTFVAVPVTLQRGRCYRMVVKLAEGASFSERARRGVAFVYHNGDRGMEVHGGPGIAEADAFKREEERKKRDRITRGCSECNQRFVECIADWRRGASRATCERERDSCAFSQAGLASARDCSR
jgi:hypothetical protein